MKFTWLFLVTFTLSVCTVMATPVLQSEGTLTIDTSAGSISLAAGFATGWVDDSLSLMLSIDTSNAGIEQLALDSSVALRTDFVVDATVVFDPQSSSFVQGRVIVDIGLQNATLALTGRLEPDALGWQFDLTATGDNALQQLTAGFNIDSFGGIQTESCLPSFTYARMDLSIPLDGCDTVATVTTSWDCAGFGELSLSVPTVGELPWGVQIGAFLTFAMDEKTLELFPTLNLDSPECFDFYTGLEWDNTANTISGIRFYGVGFRCQINDVQVRMLYSLDPSAIALVKSPYKSLIGFVWSLAGCCGGTGEASVALFFGQDNLFDLEEVQFDLVYPALDALAFSLSLTLPMDGGPSFSFGWEYGI